jgi:hypothetical protein
MPSSGMLHGVALVRTDVSEERNASIFRVTRIGELGTTLTITSTDVRCENDVFLYLCNSAFEMLGLFRVLAFVRNTAEALKLLTPLGHALKCSDITFSLFLL